MTTVRQTDQDVLAKITRVRDLCAAHGNVQMVAVLHTAMFEIERLRQELAVARQRYRLVERMVSQGLP